MDELWTTLGLDPTKDVSAIKRAYAERAKTCHPEEDSDGFMKLRQAYQAALAYAEGREGAVSPPTVPEAAEPEDEGWTLTDGPNLIDEGPNPFADHPAAKAFLDLYTGKRRKDPQAWMDYFTSGDFLDVAWERRFAGFLLEQAVRLEKEYPIPREFLTWLCAVYQFAVDRAVYRNPDGSERTEFSFRIEQDAQFEGQEFLFQLAARGPAVKPLKGAERAVSRSVADYRALLRLAEKGRWTDGKLRKAGKILDGYMLGNFEDRNPTPSERHPAGMRLINHFFRREKLPKELYQMAWQKLELKTALMGRAKLLYGDLRARVLEQVPDIAEGELDIRTLNKEFEVFRQKARALEETGKPEDWEQAGAEVRAFFSRPDFQKALRNRKFAEEHMKYHVQWSGEHFAQEVLDYYAQNPDAPCAAQLTQLIEDSRRRRRIDLRNRQDNEAEMPETLTLACRPLFRHWLNTAFYHSMERETKQPLLGYLNQEFPYLPEWSRKFLGVEGEETPEPVSVTLKLGKDMFTVQFHLRYMSFLRNGEPVRRPCLIWDQLMEWATNADTFLRLLPITAADYNQYETVKAEILRRLEDTAAPKEGRAFIAACLADQVCGLPIPDAVGMEDAEEPEWARSLPPVSFLPYQIFAENTEVLYVCIWFQRDRVLALFQQTPFGQKLMEQFEDVRDAQAAEALAKQLLEDQLHPKGFPMEALKVLPEAVYVQWDHSVVCHDEDPRPLWNIPRELHGEQVTAERLEEYLEFFDAGRVERLEWSWTCAFPVDEPPMDYEPRRSLVLMKSGGRYVCLYFDDFCAESYALLEKPEVYGQDKDVPQAVPFRQSKLFPNVLHRNFFTIRRHLEKIFSQVSWPNNVKPMAGRIWNYAVNVDHGRVKYNLDKQLLGGFPMERAHNRPDALFYFYEYPSSAALVDDGGSVETLEVTEGNRPKVQKLLADFLLGGGQKLRLTWGKTAGKRWHIVLRQDGGRFLLAWVREDKKTAEYHAADRWTYMDVEGKKYPKDNFLGKVTPAYLIHDLPALRNALDLLLANLDHPERVTSPIGEYAWEKPGKPRPFETQWAELVGDTLE
ncbi:hypothetical protein [uncultured Oscillibacter sp.]|uniref:hypothetical protein n=1 Tax=uncultured Oscillibacter sp. TaxID=876091 RepID=UPI0026334E30|nr:hypothetical protein [uncultured Oscillibacter sp.]